MNTATGKQDKYPPWSTSVLIAALLILTYMLFQYLYPLEPRYEIPYSQFKQLVREGQIESLQLQGDVARGTLLAAAAIGPQGETATSSCCHCWNSTPSSCRSAARQARPVPWQY